MRLFERLGRAVLVLGLFAVTVFFALHYDANASLWRGMEAAHAVAAPGQQRAPYDLTQLSAVTATLETIRKKYVEPERVNPKAMFLGALDAVQREVAQVIVTHEDKAPTVKVQVETESREYRVDDVQGPWDVSARLRDVFAFLQANLKDSGTDLRQVEYAACNGILRTLDPHSTFLSPDAYREMNLSTSGHFGGLGIVISIRDQLLTVMRPMPDTPAGRAGLKRYDRILKINNEATLNMPLDDAVQRLRGQPGTKVTVWVRRDGPEGWEGMRPFELTREEISVRSVTSQALGGGVGYVKLEQFQSTTAEELQQALTELGKKDKLIGLVMDLRNNPGGLLDQAAKVADLFVSDGVLVTTVGGSEGRDEKRATPGSKPAYPIVVLINGNSASASEIVAGALKNSGRAIVVGQTSFGKGSVQLVFPRVTPEGAALKLTIAQYLTPGDLSIQGVGVRPDVELDPMTVDSLEMDLFRSDAAGLKERDLTRSLASGGRRSTEQSFFELRYNLPEKERARLRELGADADDEFRLDFPVRFARDLAQKVPQGPRQEQLRAAKPFMEKAQEAELASVAAELGTLGVDWTPLAATAVGATAADFEVSVGTNRKNDTVQAGEAMTLSVTVKNNGKGSIAQLRAVTQSDGSYWTEKELVFGKLGPGESRTASVPFGWCELEGRKLGSTAPLPTNTKRVCKLPLGAITRQDVVRVRFSGEGGEPPRDAELRPTVQALPDPIFAYSYQVADNRPGNGDGQLSRGEGATVYLTVKNVGKGKSFETVASLRNLTGDGLLLHAGRFELSNMAPGEQRSVAFSFDVLPTLQDGQVTFELRVADSDLGVVSNEKVTLPIAKGPAALSEATGKVAVVGAAAALRAQPLGGAAPVAELPVGSVVQRLGVAGDYTKIKLDGERFAFVETSKLSESSAPVKYSLTPLLLRSPPLLEVSTSGLATGEDHVLIEATVTDNDRVMDAYVFLGGRKVYYQANRKSPDQKKLTLSYDVKLRPGTNVITVVARENDDTATRYTRVVRRDAKDGSALVTPKSDELGEAWGEGEP